MGESPRAPEADFAAEAGRKRNAGVGAPDGGKPLQHRRRHGRRAAPVQVDMQQHQFVGRRVVAARIVEHRVRVVDALFVETYQMGGEAQRVAADHLAEIGNMRFEHEDRAARLSHMLRAKTDMRHERIGRVIEGEDVEGDVHVIVDVEPLGAHRLTVQHQRRGVGVGRFRAYPPGAGRANGMNHGRALPARTRN